MAGGDYPTVGELDDLDGESLYRSRVSRESGCFGVGSRPGPGSASGVASGSVDDSSGKPSGSSCGDGGDPGDASPSISPSSVRTVSDAISQSGLNIGLRESEKGFRWQVSSMYAKGFSVRQIAFSLTRSVDDIESCLSVAKKQWGLEYEENLPKIRGILSAKLSDMEASIMSRMSALLDQHVAAVDAAEKESAGSGRKVRFPHRDYRQYQKLRLEIMDRYLRLYNVDASMPGDGGVHLHYTVYQHERMLDADGKAPVVDVDAVELSPEGIVRLGAPPPTPGYEDLAAERERERSVADANASAASVAGGQAEGDGGRETRKE